MDGAEGPAPAGSSPACHCVGPVRLPPYRVLMMAYYHVRPSWVVLCSPLFVFITVLLTIGVSLFLAALNVRYRDVKYAVPFVVQIWMFATPVVYPASSVPERFRPLLALNPAWGVVDGFRACMFPGVPFDLRLTATSVAMAVAVFAFGVAYFRSVEKSFADVI